MKWLGPAVVVLLAVLAELTLGKAGHAPDFALFVGRFHPLIVHLPIGFFLLVAAGEAATFHPKLRDRVEPALGLLVIVSALAALLAFLMGQLLALEGGFPSEVLGWHRRLTLLAVLGMAACWVVYDRVRNREGQGRWAYRGVLAATLGLLSLGAHFGGTMTRGETYLSRYAPSLLQPLLGGAPKEAPKAPTKAAAPSAEPLIFQDIVQPILNERCVECHGPEKQKGKLRLDSLEELMKGGENGPGVVAGVGAKSSLVERMRLPATDDDRMPPEGKPGPTPEEIALIEFWIDRGALTTLKVKDALAPTASRALLERIAGGAAKPALPGAAAPAAPASPAAADSAAPPATPTPTLDAATPKPSATSASTAPPSAPLVPEPAASPAAQSGPAVLATYCAKCHSAQKQKGKLRVDSVASLLKGGSEGPAMVPGSPDTSSILTRSRLPLDHEEHMPPKKEPQPSSTELGILAAWIKGNGAFTTLAASTSARSEATAPLAPAVAAATTAQSDAASSAAPSLQPNASAEAPTTAADAAPPVAPSPGASLDAAGSTKPVGFDAVQPLLRDKCGKCHIRDSPAGGLGVAEHEQLLEGGFSGPAIVAKNRGASPLLARVALPLSDDEHMPPEGEPQLTPDEVALLGSWIDQGAPAAAAASRPQALPARAGGCGACTLPGAPSSAPLSPLFALFGLALTLSLRRLSRASSLRAP